MNQKISIIVPVYNAAKTIGYTVNSVLTGNFDENCELILVDDGSNDSSPRLCDALSALNPLIKVVHKTNGGVSDARNVGMDNCTGDYVMFLDSDDLLPNMTLSHFRNALEYSPDIVIGGYSVCTQSGNSVKTGQIPASDRFYSQLELSMFWDDNLQHNGSYLRPVWGKLFRRELIYSDTPLRFYKSQNYGEDMLFLFAYLCRCRNVVTVSESLYIYREGNTGLSSDLSSDKHLDQLFRLCGLYSSLIEEMEDIFPQSKTVAGLRHNDLVGRLACRALTVFCTRRTKVCTRENISLLYSIMKKDASLRGVKGLFSLRPGQIPNILLYKIGSPFFTEEVYRLSAVLCELFNLRPERF